MSEHCPTCGCPVRVEGKTTKYYVPEDLLSLAEEALEEIAGNTVPGGHDQSIARTALARIRGEKNV